MSRTTAIGDIGAAFFDPATVAVGKEHNLDGFRFYFLGRGGVLGDVEPRWCTAHSGTSSPGCWRRCGTRPRSGWRHAMPPACTSCAHDLARARLARSRVSTAFCAAAEQVNDAIDPAGLALYAGLEPSRCPTTSRRGPCTCAWRCARRAAAPTSWPSWLRGCRLAMPTPSSGPTEMKQFGWPDDADGGRRRPSPVAGGRGADRPSARAGVRHARRRRPAGAARRPRRHEGRA